MTWLETECDASKAFGDFTFHLLYLHFVGMFKTLFGGCEMAFEVLYHAWNPKYKDSVCLLSHMVFVIKYFSHVVQVDKNTNLFQLCSYMIKCTNRFFRIVRSKNHGIFLEGGTCSEANKMAEEMNVP